MKNEYNRFHNAGEIVQQVKNLARDIDKALSENDVQRVSELASEMIETSSRLKGWVLEQKCAHFLSRQQQLSL